MAKQQVLEAVPPLKMDFKSSTPMPVYGVVKPDYKKLHAARRLTHPEEYADDDVLASEYEEYDLEEAGLPWRVLHIANTQSWCIDDANGDRVASGLTGSDARWLVAVANEKYADMMGGGKQ